MSRMDGRERLSEDTHFELSLAATAHERRNRPLAVVIASAGALVLAVVFGLYGLSARNSAQTELVRAVNDTAHVEQMAEEWESLHAMEDDPTGGRLGRPIPHLLSRMEELAVQAGMEKPRPPRVVPRPRDGITVIEYHYGEHNNPITHTSLSGMLEWLRLAQGEELGMEVIGLNLRPGTNDWRMTVTFRRWERAG